MRFPDVIRDLNELGRRLHALEREFEFHHGQFRQAVFHVKHLAQALEASRALDEPSAGAAATLVAACTAIEEVLVGSQDSEVPGQAQLPLS